MFYAPSMATSTPADTTYALSDDHVAFRDTIRQIVSERVAPRAAEIDAKAEYPWDLRKLFAEQDLLGLPFEEEYGGTGTGTLMLNMAIEEVAKACASTALILMVQELGTLPIRLFGSDELKQRFLPRCASGEWSPAFALSEPEAGSDPGGMITTARRDGDEWVINGTKNWITNLGIADFYVVFAVTDRESAPALRLRGRGRPPRLQRRQARAQARHQGLADRPADLRRRPHPGREPGRRRGQGPLVALGTLDHSRLGVAAQAVGIAQGATDYAAGYARERKQFGQPINEFQGIQFKLADMETQDGRRARAALQGVREDRPPRARPRQVLRDGQAVRLRHRDGRHDRGGAGPRRLRLRDASIPSSASCATPRSPRSTRARTRSSAS